jgi:hypothetical protein
MSASGIPDVVVRFVNEKIDAVSQLEALLLLWEGPQQAWSIEQIAARLYVSDDAAAAIMKNLQVRGLVRSEGTPPAYTYATAWDPSGEVMTAVACTYRHQLVQVATLIHSRAPSPVREFARAFDLKKDR